MSSLFCFLSGTYKLAVVQGKTYMLRIINAALNNQLFFAIANHTMTVVAVDASYTNPYVTNVVVVAPGQTTDVLLKTYQPLGSYYMAARPYASVQGIPLPVDATTTRGVIQYLGASLTNVQMPILPDLHDTPTAHKFYSSLTSLTSWRQWVPVPMDVDEHMFVTFGLNLAPCQKIGKCTGVFGQRMSASMNQESFQLPTSSSILQAFYNKKSGIYTSDFPNNPSVKFDYTNPLISFNLSLLFARKSTKVKKLKFNSTVEIVLQNTAFIAVENHPIHIHGFNFHVLAQGFGNYDPINDPKSFNLVNPQIRNTIAVPVGGWAVIRFTANNPGMFSYYICAYYTYFIDMLEGSRIHGFILHLFLTLPIVLIYSGGPGVPPETCMDQVSSHPNHPGERPP